MAKAFEIAEGELNITADIRDAIRNLERLFAAVDRKLDTVEDRFAESGDDSGENFVEGVESRFGQLVNMPGFARAFNELQEEHRRRGILAGRRFRDGVDDGIGGDRDHKIGLIPDGGRDRNIFGRLMDGAKGFFSMFAKGFTEAIGAGIDGAKGLWQQASTFFQQIGNIAGGLGAVLQVGIIAALIPVILGLGGALMQLSAALFALPAAGAVAVAAILPLVIAFKGFGEAVSAGLSGDVDAFNEALKGLAPNARTVAREFVALGPALKGIKRDVQDAFFGPLVGQMSKLAPLLTTVRSGMTLVAAALGRFAAGFVDLLGSEDVVEAIGDVFESTGRIVDRVGPSIINLVGMLFGVTEKGLPFVERFFGAFADGIDYLAGWLSQIQQDGSLTRWLEQAWSIGKDLFNIAKELFLVFVNLFSQTGDEGQGFLKGILGPLKKLNEYLTSENGREFIDDLAGAITAMGYIIAGVVVTFIALGDAWLVAKAGGQALWGWLVGAWNWLGGAISSTIAWVKSAASNVWGWIKSVGSAIGGFFASIGEWIAGAWNFLVVWGGRILGWFAALPGLIGGWLAALPGRMRDAWMQMFNAVLYGIGFIAGSIVKFIMVDVPAWFEAGWERTKRIFSQGVDAVVGWSLALPGRIWSALVSTIDIIGGIVSAAWTWARSVFSDGVETVARWSRELPGRIWSALSGLASMIGGFFSDAWNRARDSTRQGVDGAMSWINGFPGRARNALSGAGTWLVESGRNMIRGLVDGLQDMLNWAVQRAKDAANRIKQGFLDALDIGSPSRAMRVEVGRWILPGVMQGVDDTMPKMERYLGATSQALISGLQPSVNVAAPNVNVGGFTLIADLGEGIRQVVPLTIMNNPRTVAASAAVGNRERSGWVNTARGQG